MGIFELEILPVCLIQILHADFDNTIASVNELVSVRVAIPFS